MQDQFVMNQVTALFSFLKHHVDLSTKTTLNDIGFSLETFFMDLFNKFDGENNWVNANVENLNQPAIDLINRKSKHALQVTVRADSTKIKKTIEMYEKHKVDVDKITIIGFLHHTNYKKNNSETVGIDYITRRIKGCSLVQKTEILDLIKNSIPVHVLSPLSDSDCFDVIQRMLDRSALRDDRYCEGSYEDMIRGLKEAKDLITSGVTSKVGISTKPISGYTEPLQSELSDIEYKISDIIRICNRSKRDNFVILSMNEKIEIDRLKDEIINQMNLISSSLGKKKY
ncbi:SMEK domain-containing protein [Paenibacillus sonchi]|uniref:SMEK domain-containing protein n=1 Tax=Paenibacillus sonchi TaxID=373687 RepID=A0A974P7L7_9BACL|nr:SMEK domain-containing protein [Paenibacillus sonchi]QQZ58907.1 SMEK domain-containing protein [Paenibacillus sonchi]